MSWRSTEAPNHEPPELPQGFGVRWLAGNGADTALEFKARVQAKAVCALAPHPPHSKTLARDAVHGPNAPPTLDLKANHAPSFARSKTNITERADKAVRAPWISGLARRPELLVFVALLVVFNVPLLVGSVSHSMIFEPAAVLSGEWWRVVTHPFVHATWYHWLLDGIAFLALYGGLIEPSVLRRLGYVVSAGAGSLLISCAASPAISINGLCGLSGIAHGLMAISALEMFAQQSCRSPEFRIGLICFILVVGKAALEAVSGRMFFTFLHFGLMGEPVAVAHAGGIVGSLLAAALLMNRSPRAADD